MKPAACCPIAALLALILSAAVAGCAVNPVPTPSSPTGAGGVTTAADSAELTNRKAQDAGVVGATVDSAVPPVQDAAAADMGAAADSSADAASAADSAQADAADVTESTDAADADSPIADSADASAVAADTLDAMDSGAGDAADTVIAETAAAETAGAETAGAETVVAESLPPTEEKALLAWLTAGAYAGWAAESKVHQSTGPHFGGVRTFVSSKLLQSLQASTTPHPVDAATVKEMYGSGTQVLGWAVMRKTQSGAGGNTWWWYEYYNGKVYAASQGAGLCTGCHAPGKDYFVSPFPLQ